MIDKSSEKFRFRRQDIVTISDSIEIDNAICNWTGSLTPLLRVLVTLDKEGYVFSPVVVFKVCVSS